MAKAGGGAGGSGADTDAIHDNVAAEISAVTEKTNPVDADVALIEDSAASNAKKRLSWSNIKATLKTYFDTLYSALGHTHTESDISDLDHDDTDAIHDNVAAEISAVTEKTTPVDADVALIEDSAASNAKKRLSWSNIKATLKTYFDTLYMGISNFASTAEINTGTDTTKAINADKLAASIHGRKSVIIEVFAAGTSLATGDGKAYFPVPKDMDGMNLVDCYAGLKTPSSSGLPSIQIHNLTGTVDMLSTNITIDANELHSKDATTAKVIDTAHDDIAHGDLLRIDVDVAGTGADGLWIELIAGVP